MDSFITGTNKVISAMSKRYSQVININRKEFIKILLENKEDYKGYIRLVLAALIKVDFRLKLSKYKFRVKETLFLGYIIRLG